MFKDIIRSWRKSKTVFFGTLLSVLGLIQNSTDVLSQFMSPKSFGLFVLVIGVIVIVLRAVTNQPLSEKA